MDSSAAASAEETVAEGLADEVLNVPVCLAESRQVLEDHLQRLEEGGGQPDSVLCVWHGGRIAALQAHVCSQMHYGVLCSLCSPCVNQPHLPWRSYFHFVCVCVCVVPQTLLQTFLPKRTIQRLCITSARLR